MPSDSPSRRCGSRVLSRVDDVDVVGVDVVVLVMEDTTMEETAIKWLDTLSHTEPVFVAMRQLREKADRLLADSRTLMPHYGEVGVGGAHMDGLMQGEGLCKFLHEIGKGATPQQAAESAKAEAALYADNWNKRASHHVQRWPHGADALIDDAMRAILTSAK